MSAQQELIAAALALCDVAATDYEGAYRAKRDLREACARAMVQPAAPDIAEVERLAHAYADEKLARYGLFGNRSLGDPERAFAALLDAVRAIVAERDQFRDAAEMVQPVGEVPKGRRDDR